MTYRPELDGLRAISILLVIISHAGFGNLVPGGLGVTVFFFISGYLITSLLIAEHQINNRIQLYKFYMRRFWRLLPPVIIFILISILLIIYINKTISISQVLAAVLYFANYYKIFFHFDNLLGNPSPFNILWSLAIEEHFYIIFAPLLAYTYRSEKYFKVVVAFMFIPLCIRVGMLHFYPNLLQEGGYTYSATETRLDTISFGCFLAFIFSKDGFLSLKKIMLSDSTFALSVVLIFVTLLIRDMYFRETIRYTLQNVSILIIVSNILFSPATPRNIIRSWLSRPSLVLIGKLSYSLYLQHWLSLIVVSLLIGGTRLSFEWQISYWLLTLILSLFSYYVIEKKTIHFRKKFGSNVS